MKITEQIGLEEKFNTIPNVQVGSLLRFKSNGDLEAVNPEYQGITPQIKVIADPSSTVSCTKSGGQQVQVTSKYPNNTWYFNVPGKGTYNIIVNSSTNEVIVNQYKQYTVNAIS